MFSEMRSSFLSITFEYSGTNSFISVTVRLISRAFLLPRPLCILVLLVPAGPERPCTLYYISLWLISWMQFYFFSHSPLFFSFFYSPVAAQSLENSLATNVKKNTLELILLCGPCAALCKCMWTNRRAKANSLWRGGKNIKKKPSLSTLGSQIGYVHDTSYTTWVTHTLVN